MDSYRKENSEVRINIATLLLLLLIFVPTVLLGIKGRLTRGRPLDQPPTQQVAIADLIGFANERPTYDNFFKLGFAYYQKGMLVEAVEAYKGAIQINPSAAIAYDNMGVALGEMGKYDQQIDAARKALEIDPTYERAKHNLAWAHKQMNQSRQ